MNDVFIIKNPEVAKLLSDKTRCKLLALLRLGEFSTMDLAKALGKTPQAISYHLRLMESAGLIRVTRTELKRNLIEKYYRAVAKRFIVSYQIAESPETADIVKELLTEAAEGLKMLGYNLSEEVGAELLHKYMILKSRVIEELLSRKRGELPRGSWILLEFLAAVRMASKPEFKQLLEEAEKVLA